MNKTAFVVSIVLTTFVLMAIGGIVYALRTPDVVAAPGGSEEAGIEQVSAAVGSTSDPSLEQTLLERETIYQQRIAEANARLEEAQQQLAAQVKTGDNQGNSLIATNSITADQAAQIVADYLGFNNVAWVEIVSVQGEEMYLVTLISGDLFYVNMTGQIVGSAPAQFSGSSGGGGGKILSSYEGGQEWSDDDDHTEDEHEDEYDDEHDDEHEGEHD